MDQDDNQCWILVKSEGLPALKAVMQVGIPKCYMPMVLINSNALKKKKKKKIEILIIYKLKSGYFKYMLFLIRMVKYR